MDFCTCEREAREGSSEMKELEKERMLRLEAEQRLRDTRMESDTCRARLKALQEEFTRMEETVQSMLQYKTKIEQLKQEKTNLASTYESSILKHRNHISKLERENIVLLNQVKKLESQLNTKTDESTGVDKSKLLMERLKILEAENSGLVLENEQQRQQYEKCLDEIANQVVQALLAQKSLREECTKLQGRVQDLELQNQQLRSMFQTRIRYASDSHLQKSPHSSDSSKTNSILGSSMIPPQISSHHHQPCHMTQYQGEIIYHNILSGSLQSMNSDYSFDESFGQPQMSSPPPWLRDKLEDKLREGGHDPEFHTTIETEFPATNTSPKVKRINVYDRSYGSWGRTPPKPQRKGKTANRKSPRNSQNMSSGATATSGFHQRMPEKIVNVPSPMPKPSSTQFPSSKMSSTSSPPVAAERSNSSSPKQPFRSQYFYDYSDEDSDCRPMTKDVSSSSTVSLNELLDSSLEGADLPTDEDFYSDWSPINMSPKPLPIDLSAMKTMQNFMYPSPLKNTINTTSSIKPCVDSKIVSQVNSITSPSLITAVSSSSSCNMNVATSNSADLMSNLKISQTIASDVSPSVATSQTQGNKQVISIYGYTNGASPKPCRPDNLILVPRDKNFILNSLSSSGSEGNKTLSSPSPQSVSEKSVALQSETRSPVMKSSPIERKPSKSKHYVEIQVKKPLEPKKRSAIESTNKSKVATIVPTPRSPKKSPPPVPQKPVRSNIPAAKGTDPKKLGSPKNLDAKKRGEAKSVVKSPSNKLQGIVNPIVNPIVNSVIIDPINSNFPVLDLGFGPKWPTSETNLDSARVERSGSRDDGYSTMSSDIQPEAMEKFSDAATIKKGDIKISDVRPDTNSDPDSAMENSSHSAELQNSTHSLSSQVSTSSGENILSPSGKVREMRKVFEEDTHTIKSAKKSGIPVIRSPLGPKLQFFQTTESRSLENLPMDKIEESPELTVKTSWNYHSFNETKTIPPINRFNYNENQVINLPIGDDHLLEDIPEDRELETIPLTIYTRLQSSPPSPPIRSKSSIKIKDSHRLTRCVSDSNIYSPRKTRAPTLYDDFSDGQWNNEKYFERSISVSEMDMIDSNSRYVKLIHRKQIGLSMSDIDESDVDESVKRIIKDFLMSKMSMTSSTTTDSDSDSEIEAAIKVNREWLKKNGDYRLPHWQPKETLEALKKRSTPSPVSIKRFDSSTSEDWLLKFSKEEIESHLATAALNSSSLNTDEKHNPYMAYSDLSSFASSDSSTVIGDSSSPEKDADISGIKILDSSSSCTGEGNSLVSEEGNLEASKKSPSPDQKKFHSEFYSLCLVESNRSLVSSSSHEMDIHKLVAKDTVGGDNSVSFKAREFDEISRQIQSLSKTVNDLHESLSSLNSADSGSRDELMDCHTSKAIHQENRNSMDGYHWEEDDYYLTSCGGEVIIGSDSMLDRDNCSDWINNLEVGGDADHSAEINEEFYEIQVNVENCTHVSGYVYNGNQSDEVPLHDASFEPCESINYRSSSTNQLVDPEHRANLLDTMLASGGDSNDSLASDIGLDHMMCQRLVGRKARHEALRCTSMPRQTLDFSKFFIRFDQPEKEAVAAFNFLEDISTSTSESGSEQRLFNPEEESDGHYQAAEVYIVDNHAPRSRRGDKIRRRRKIDKSRSKQKPMSSAGVSKTLIGPSLTYGSKKMNESLNTSSDAPEICAGNLSLSDSCCESFSSSDQSVNDLTML